MGNNSQKALRIVANQDYIAHSEPICKALNLVKFPDMYTCAVWNFYYKLMNNLLPIYFENCKPTLPRIDQLYNVKKLFSIYLRLNINLLNKCQITN